MAGNIRIEVHGVARAIKELRNLEPTLYRRLTADLRTSAQPLARAVGAEFPDEPLMNWHSSGGRRGASRLPPYNSSSARSGVKPAVSTSRRSGASSYGILRIQQYDAGGQVYDSAGSVAIADGKTSSALFVANLDKGTNTNSRQGRTRSRVMYPFTKKYLPQLIPAIQESVDRTSKIVQESINRGI
jgi:hypothetical protein